METGNEIALDNRGYWRESYEVDGMRVTHHARLGWQCTCGAHSEARPCAHVDQANAFQQMRGRGPQEEDTLELELSAVELRAIAQPPVEKRSEIPRVSRRAAIAATAVIAAISSGVTYVLATQRATVAVAADVTLPIGAFVSESPPPAAPPVTFVNPFDATEVFAFPANTSESAAREAVADLLLQRARSRIASSSAELQAADGKRPRPTRIAQIDPD